MQLVILSSISSDITERIQVIENYTHLQFFTLPEYCCCCSWLHEKWLVINHASLELDNTLDDKRMLMVKLWDTPSKQNLPAMHHSTGITDLFDL